MKWKMTFHFAMLHVHPLATQYFCNGSHGSANSEDGRDKVVVVGEGKDEGGSDCRGGGEEFYLENLGIK